MTTCFGLTIRTDVFTTLDSRSIGSVTFSADHFEPLDVACILIEFEIFGPRGSVYFPRATPLTHDHWKQAYRAACRSVLIAHRDLLVSCGLMEWWQMPTPDAVDYFFEEGFSPWKQSTLREAMLAQSIASKRLTAIRTALHSLGPLSAMRLFGACVADGGLRSITGSGGTPSRLSAVRSWTLFTQLHELAFERPDVLFVGEDGRWYIRGRLLRRASRNRRKDANATTHRPLQDAPEISSRDSGPLALATARELIALVRAVQEVAQSKGPEYMAAVEYFGSVKSRAEIAAKYSISEKALRIAEATLHADLQRLASEN